MKMALVQVGWLLLAVGVAPAAQICRDDIPATAPDSRFTDNDNGTVTDVAAGLMWKQCAEGLSWPGCVEGEAGLFTWQQALATPAGAEEFAGYADWRLPNKNELESLIERRCRGPAVNIMYFPNTPSVSFWSSSPGRDGATAWYVSFEGGDTDTGYKTVMRPVRLVRDQQ